MAQGRCTVCGKIRSLDDDGMVRRHRRKGSTETGPISQSRDLCLGSYERPDVELPAVEQRRYA
jgi:hypothetical protein